MNMKRKENSEFCLVIKENNMLPLRSNAGYNSWKNCDLLEQKLSVNLRRKKPAPLFQQNNLYFNFLN